MKQFFGAFFGSIIGIVIATLLAVFVIVAVVKSGFEDTFKKNKNTLSISSGPLIHLVLSGSINEREIDDPFAELERLGRNAGSKGSGLNTMIRKIDQAKNDEKVKGIYLELKGLDAGYASIIELRNALIDFKSSGKFIYAYSEGYSQRDYYLASAANKIFVHPEGGIEFKGLSMSIMFYKQALEKLEIEAQIFRHGKFKSAIEPFMLDKMSEANRLQSEVFLNSIWQSMLEGIGKERKLTASQMNEMANELSIQNPEDAVKSKLIDALAYKDEVMTQLRKKAGIDEKSKLVEFSNYASSEKSNISKNKIAVIYANGGISSGEGDDEEIGSDRIARAIHDAGADEKVKAIVLRVNSPGGSALASDVIWREVKLAKKNKPFIVSMGNYAASGGYYISCAADRIFAQPNTITGSIGVFGVIPNLQKTLQNKLGITIDTINTNKYSNMGSALMPVREKEREYIQRSIEKVYDTFISKVAEGRNMDKALVDSIGQGRVWTGTEALNIHLVDELGGLNDAVNYAAKNAELSDYKIIELPKPKNALEKLFGKAEDEAESRILQKKLGSTYIYLKQIKSLAELKGIQARLPFELDIK